MTSLIQIASTLQSITIGFHRYDLSFIHGVVNVTVCCNNASDSIIETVNYLLGSCSREVEYRK